MYTPICALGVCVCVQSCACASLCARVARVHCVCACWRHLLCWSAMLWACVSASCRVHVCLWAEAYAYVSISSSWIYITLSIPSSPASPSVDQAGCLQQPASTTDPSYQERYPAQRGRSTKAARRRRRRSKAGGTPISISPRLHHQARTQPGAVFPVRASGVRSSARALCGTAGSTVTALALWVSAAGKSSSGCHRGRQPGWPWQSVARSIKRHPGLTRGCGKLARGTAAIQAVGPAAHQGPRNLPQWSRANKSDRNLGPTSASSNKARQSGSQQGRRRVEGHRNPDLRRHRTTCSRGLCYGPPPLAWPWASRELSSGQTLPGWPPHPPSLPTHPITREPGALSAGAGARQEPGAEPGATEGRAGQ